jgi:hypothetical protein
MMEGKDDCRIEGAEERMEKRSAVKDRSGSVELEDETL